MNINIEEAVKIIKELIDGVKEYGYDYTVEEAVVINKSEYNAIETLLTAYEKEKEERERIGKLYYEANENCIKYEKKIEKEKEKNKKADYFMISNLTGKTLVNLIEKQSKEIEELKEKSNKYYYEWKHLEANMINKIKAKIEEIDEVLKGQLIEKIRLYFEAQKEVLQSLLEKE